MAVEEKRVRSSLENNGRQRKVRLFAWANNAIKEKDGSLVRIRAMKKTEEEYRYSRGCPDLALQVMSIAWVHDVQRQVSSVRFE